MQELQPMINPSIETEGGFLSKFNITEEDKERFLKSVLADRPYEEVHKLFDGELRLKFKGLTVQENTDVVNQIVADKQNGIAADNDAYFITIATYRLALSLISVDDATYSSITKENFSPSVEGETYVRARAKTMLGWSTAKLSIYLECFKTFESKVIKLTTEVMTPNFWKASA